jgi:tetratricopeptide (TPR) repeat protein
MTGTDLHRDQEAAWIRVLLIVGAVLWIYAPAFYGDWIWDDTSYIPAHFSHSHLEWWTRIWTRPVVADYDPLESSLLLLEWCLWGQNTLGYHLTSVALHITSALLIWRLLHQIGLRQAWLVGLIFAVHPIVVESVAWIVELKNTLSLPPLLLAMSAYVAYVEKNRSRDYLLALVFFLVAMLCKPSTMMFPAIILLYVWWKTGRLEWSDCGKVSPFFVVSLVFGMVAASLQGHQNDNGLAVPVGVPERLATVGWAILFLFFKCLFPFGYMPVYPSELIVTLSASDLVPWALIGILLGVLWQKRKSWGRGALLGIGFFLLNLVPVIGFVFTNASTMIWSLDHLVYLPVIGLIGLVAGGGDWLLKRVTFCETRPLMLGATAVVIALLAWESHAYAAIFRDEETFWTVALRSNPGSLIAHNNLGTVFMTQGRMKEAVQEFNLVLQINPRFYRATNNLGYALMIQNRLPEAEACLEDVTRTKPDFAVAHFNLGRLLSRTGRLSEAVAQFETGLDLDPENFRMRFILADMLSATNQIPEAIEQYERALKTNPDVAEGQYNLGNLLVRTGHLPEAVEHYEQALRINPDYADARANLGTAELQLGQIVQAIEQYEQVVRINPRDVDTRNSLGLVLMKIGHPAEAAEQFEAVLQIEPQNANAKGYLSQLRGMNVVPISP